MNLNIENLLKDFKNPPVINRPHYFWFLNHDLNIEEMKKQLEIMKKSGAGGAFLHSRHGRITPYMSEKWMDICAEVIKYGSEIGLKVWLYDEDGFPSGFVGGETILPNPKDFSANFIVLNDEFEIESGKTLDVDIILENKTSEIFGIVAIEVKETDLGYDLLNFPEKVIDLSNYYSNGHLKWEAPKTANNKGLWLVLPFIREWNTRAANVLSKDAMKRFIEITHQKYYDNLKKNNLENLLGNTIPGIFTDEPGVMYCIGDKSWRRIIPFTPNMVMEYEKKYTIPLLRGLPALFFDVDGNNVKYRLNYWLLASEFYSNNYYKQIGDWCEKHNIYSTGHLANDSCLFNQVRDQIDWFKNAQYMHIGPSDQLGSLFRAKFESSYGLAETDNMMAPRFAASAGRLYDLPYNISECFGSAGWELSLKTQKTLIDWQVANGINLFTPHDFSYSIEGARKRDHPPSFESCSYFEEINILNTYIGRLCALFSHKESSVYPRIGILYGNLTILANMNPMQSNAASVAHDAQAYIIDILQRIHYDFDILPEDFIINATITDSLIGDEKNKYDLIIIPALSTIKAETEIKLIQFYKNGGNVLCIKKIPHQIYSENLKNYKTGEFFNLFGLEMNVTIDYIEKNKILNDIDESVFIPNFIEMKNDNHGKIGFLQAVKSPIWKNHLLDLIESFLFKIKNRGVGVSTNYKDGNTSNLNYVTDQNGDIIVRRLNLESDDNNAIILIANVSDEKYPDSTIVISNNVRGIRIWEKFWIYQLHSINGSITKIKPIDIHPDKMGNIRIHWEFEPNESVILYVTQTELDLKVIESLDSLEFDGISKINKQKKITESILSNWKINTRNNILNLDKWSVAYSVEKMGIERPSYLRYILNHTITIEIEKKPELLQLILDGNIKDNRNGLKVMINGKEVKNLKSGEILDFHMIETKNIANLFIEGKNKIEIVTTGGLSSPMFSLTEPLRIYGDFIVISKSNLKNEQEVLVITKKSEIESESLSDLKKIGFPNYIYPVDYETTFQINNDEIDKINEFDYFIKLPIQEEPLFKVWLNDKLEGHVWFGDYRLKLKNIKNGKNTLKIKYYPFPIYLFEKTEMPLGLFNDVKLEKIQKN